MFVLVHGAGMGADCWDRMLPHLSGPRSRSTCRAAAAAPT